MHGGALGVHVCGRVWELGPGVAGCSSSSSSSKSFLRDSRARAQPQGNSRGGRAKRAG